MCLNLLGDYIKNDIINYNITEIEVYKVNIIK